MYSQTADRHFKCCDVLAAANGPSAIIACWMCGEEQYTSPYATVYGSPLALGVVFRHTGVPNPFGYPEKETYAEGLADRSPGPRETPMGIPGQKSPDARGKAHGGTTAGTVREAEEAVLNTTASLADSRPPYGHTWSDFWATRTGTLQDLRASNPER